MARTALPQKPTPKAPRKTKRPSTTSPSSSPAKKKHKKTHPPAPTASTPAPAPTPSKTASSALPSSKRAALASVGDDSHLWKHPAELELIHPPELTQPEIIFTLLANSFSIPPPPPPSSQFITIVSSSGTTTTLPVGYRLPLLFAANYLWESLRLVLTSTVEGEWDAFKFDLLNLSRLTSAFLDAARMAERARKGKGMYARWRCAMFDRVLTRYWWGWMVNRPEYVKAFWIEFKEDEYEIDVLRRDWKSISLKGHNGFYLTQEEIDNGLTASQLTIGLSLNPTTNRYEWDNEAYAKAHPGSVEARELEDRGSGGENENENGAVDGGGDDDSGGKDGSADSARAPLTLKDANSNSPSYHAAFECMEILALKHANGMLGQGVDGHGLECLGGGDGPGGDGDEEGWSLDGNEVSSPSRLASGTTEANPAPSESSLPSASPSNATFPSESTVLPRGPITAFPSDASADLTVRDDDDDGGGIVAAAEGASALTRTRTLSAPAAHTDSGSQSPIPHLATVLQPQAKSHSHTSRDALPPSVDPSCRSSSLSGASTTNISGNLEQIDNINNNEDLSINSNIRHSNTVPSSSSSRLALHTQLIKSETSSKPFLAPTPTPHSASPSSRSSSPSRTRTPSQASTRNIQVIEKVASMVPEMMLSLRSLLEELSPRKKRDGKGKEKQREVNADDDAGSTRSASFISPSTRGESPSPSTSTSYLRHHHQHRLPSSFTRDTNQALAADLQSRIEMLEREREAVRREVRGLREQVGVLSRELGEVRGVLVERAQTLSVDQRGMDMVTSPFDDNPNIHLMSTTLPSDTHTHIFLKDIPLPAKSLRKHYMIASASLAGGGGSAMRGMMDDSSDDDDE